MVNAVLLGGAVARTSTGEDTLAFDAGEAIVTTIGNTLMLIFLV